MLFLLPLLAPAVVVALGGPISPLTIKGTQFVTTDSGERVFFKGLAYQRSTPQDPFLNASQCQLDAMLMRSLGCNAIRSYHVDPRGNHDECMGILADAGIYLFLDVATHGTQIEGKNPRWTTHQFNSFTKVIDAFQKYDNLAGFFITNEAVTTPDETAAAPYLKAAVRDTKAYIKEKGGRYIPMGYSAADIASIRPMFQNYLACGPPDEAIDFFAVNIYEWCGDSSYPTSGYSDRMAELEGYPIPVFFSEIGCNLVRPRTFSDMRVIYGPQMSPILSGAIVYEWTQEENDYGIVEYPDKAIQDGVEVPVGSPIPLQPEFDNLKRQWASVNATGIDISLYTLTATTMACPAITEGWPIDPNSPIPGTPTPIPTKVPAGSDTMDTANKTESGNAPTQSSGHHRTRKTTLMTGAADTRASCKLIWTGLFLRILLCFLV